MNAPWEFQFLGKLAARRGDQTITRFASSRVAALLARLVLFPHRDHPREELVDLLWPDSDLDAGRLNLRVALASLRRQLEPPDVPSGSVVAADRATIRLRPAAFRCDAADFEAAVKNAAYAPSFAEKRAALDQALALFSGELLPGFYDDWIGEERERLNALCEDARQQRAALPEASLQGTSWAGDAPLPAASAILPSLASSPPLNFPLQWTRFFGRETETAEINRRLMDPQTRLATLSGAGGSGKTRLALEAARHAATSFSGPVCFVPLADLADAAAIPDAIAQALALTRSASTPVLEQIAAYLLPLPPGLLVLDNFEHLVERGAPALFSLLGRVPSLTCLVTSRRRLALPGEWEFPVPPLPLPDNAASADQAVRNPSVQLFTDRAQAGRPDFQITAHNASAVAALCRTLEGIPLALELAAARVPALTPAQINERLLKRFEILTSRRGDKGGRHRSLWAALAWSVDLLSPSLQQFFSRLSVFRGGWTAEAAEAVCEEPGALECLTQLRERSLVVIDEAPGEMRFRLLETLREFGEEQLDDAARDALAWQHADWYTALAREAWPQLTGPDQAAWLSRLDADYDNLRVAMEFWLASDAVNDAATESALEICGSVWRFWSVRGHIAEALDWQRRALARFGGLPYTRARAANGAGNLVWMQGDYAAAEDFYRISLEIMRGLDLKTSIGAVLCNLGILAMHRENFAQAEALQAEALTLRRSMGDTGGVAFTLQCQAETAQRQRNHPLARRLYEESLALWVTLDDDSGRLWTLANLGAIAQAEGEPEVCADLTVQALALCVKLQDKQALHALLAQAAGLYAGRGEWAQAARLQGASETVRRRIGVGLSPQDAADREREQAGVRARLTASEYDAAWASGAALTEAQAVALAGG